MSELGLMQFPLFSLLMLLVIFVNFAFPVDFEVEEKHSVVKCKWNFKESFMP